jgi:predicted phage terminase large subunit-like protein
VKFKPVGDKITQFSNQLGKIEAGRVHIPKKAPWPKDFMHEILAFPRENHDDQVDSVSQFLSWLDEKSSRYSTVHLSLPEIHPRRY